MIMARQVTSDGSKKVYYIWSIVFGYKTKVRQLYESMDSVCCFVLLNKSPRTARKSRASYIQMRILLHFTKLVDQPLLQYIINGLVPPP